MATHTPTAFGLDVKLVEARCCGSTCPLAVASGMGDRSFNEPAAVSVRR